MPTLLQVGGDVDFGATPSEASVTEGSITVRDTLSGVFGDIDILTELGGAYMPIGDGSGVGGSGDASTPHPLTQVVELRVSCPALGVDWGPNDMLDVSVERSLREGSSWAIGIAASRLWGMPNKLGYELDWWAPPPGVKEIHVDGVYQTSDGVRHEMRLITDGVTNDSGRSLVREGHIMEISGLGPMGRYDRVLVSLQLEPNHGTTHGELIDMLADLAGVPASQRAVSGFGTPRNKPVEICLEEWWGIAQELADSMNHAIYWDRSGVLTMRPYYDTSQTAQFIFDEKSIEASGGVKISSVAEIPTCVKVSGQRQADPSLEGLVTKITVLEEYLPWNVETASYYQYAYGTGDIDPMPSYQPPSDNPEIILVKRRTTKQTSYKSCLVLEEVIEEGWKWRECARYAQTGREPTRVNDSYRQCYFYVEPGGSPPVKDDNTPAYADPSMIFTELTRQITTYGAFDSQLTSAGTSVGTYCGRLHAVDVKIYDWYKETVAEQVNTNLPQPDPIWEYEAGEYFGGGERAASVGGPVTPSREYYRNDGGTNYYRATSTAIGEGEGASVSTALTGEATGLVVTHIASQTTQVFHYVPGDCPFLTGTETISWVRERPRGEGNYKWSDGFVGGERWECFDVRTSEAYVAQGETSHSVISSQEHAKDGVTGRQLEKKDGYLPQGTTCACDDRGETQEVHAEVCGFEDNHTGYLSTVSNEWIESVDEAEALATRLLLEGAAITVTIVTSCNLALNEGDKHSIHLPKWGITTDGYIERVTWAKDGVEDPTLATIEFMIIPDVALTEVTG